MKILNFVKEQSFKFEFSSSLKKYSKSIRAIANQKTGNPYLNPYSNLNLMVRAFLIMRVICH